VLDELPLRRRQRPDATERKRAAAHPDRVEVELARGLGLPRAGARRQDAVALDGLVRAKPEDAYDFAALASMASKGETT